MEVNKYLCTYDLRNPEGVISFFSKKEVEEEGYNNSSKENCSCDNCYYGRTKLAEYILLNTIQKQ